MYHHDNSIDYAFTRYGGGAGCSTRNSIKSRGAFASDIPQYDGGDDRGSDRPKSAALVIVIARYGGKVDCGLINCAIMQNDGKAICCSQNIARYNIDGPKIEWNPALAWTGCEAPHDSEKVA